MDFLKKLRKLLHRTRQNESEKYDEKASVLPSAGII